jgi:hypothetical protein
MQGLVLWVCFALLSEAEWSFEGDSPGAPAARIEVVTQKQAAAGVWSVKQDGGTRVLVHTCAASKDPALALLKTPPSKGVSIESRLKTISGAHVVGLVWHFKDASNYYLARVRTEPGNISIERVDRAVPTTLASLDTQKVMGGEWFRLRVEQRGATIRVLLNDRQILQAQDRIFAAGRTGLMSDAGTVSYFDDILVGQGRRVDLSATFRQ